MSCFSLFYAYRGGILLIFNELPHLYDLPYYILGSWIAILGWHKSLLTNERLQAFLLIVASIFFVYHTYVADSGLSVLCFSSTLTLFMFIMRANVNHPFAKFFINIGKISLDIYVIHWFFLISFLYPKPFFSDGSIANIPLIFQIGIIVGMSLLIISICWLISKTIRLNKFLTFIMLGRY